MANNNKNTTYKTQRQAKKKRALNCNIDGQKPDATAHRTLASVMSGGGAKGKLRQGNVVIRTKYGFVDMGGYMIFGPIAGSD